MVSPLAQTAAGSRRSFLYEAQWVVTMPLEFYHRPNGTAGNIHLEIAVLVGTLVDGVLLTKCVPQIEQE
ncbi:hypothetical protein CDL15_Pgr012674 [Punica granatum]|uniref:Uncharacterized protein n=1 Tax=Punica granatum TaxID=22663 RepID=A0A218XUP1_PUNGR|nr:hypothetical protein CDL15_Pgr012674 [Punica granatum]